MWCPRHGASVETQFAGRSQGRKYSLISESLLKLHSYGCLRDTYISDDAWIAPSMMVCGRYPNDNFTAGKPPCFDRTTLNLATNKPGRSTLFEEDASGQECGAACLHSCAHETEDHELWCLEEFLGQCWVACLPRPTMTQKWPIPKSQNITWFTGFRGKNIHQCCTHLIKP